MVNQTLVVKKKLLDELALTKFLMFSFQPNIIFFGNSNLGTIKKTIYL